LSFFFPLGMVPPPIFIWAGGGVIPEVLAMVCPYDTILTPFSHSSVTDSAVDSLPELFLAYCTIADSDDVMSDDD
jgi:hypothetical protein